MSKCKDILTSINLWLIWCNWHTRHFNNIQASVCSTFSNCVHIFSNTYENTGPFNRASPNSEPRHLIRDRKFRLFVERGTVDCTLMTANLQPK